MRRRRKIKKKSLLLNKPDFFKQSDQSSFPTFPTPLDSSFFSDVLFESEESSELVFGGISSLEDSFLKTDTPGNGDGGQPQLNTFSVGASRHRIR